DPRPQPRVRVASARRGGLDHRRPDPRRGAAHPRRRPGVHLPPLPLRDPAPQAQPDRERAHHAPARRAPAGGGGRVAPTSAGGHLGAVMVMDGLRLTGIFTERDLMGRVVAPGLDPNTTRLAQVMTRNPDTIGADDTALDALQMMRKSGYRHLPVAKDGRIVGM